MDSIPLEIIALIYRHLCGKCIITCAKVCQSWKNAADFYLSTPRKEIDEKWKDICMAKGVSHNLHDRSALSWKDVYRNSRLWNYSIGEKNKVIVNQSPPIATPDILRSISTLHVYKNYLITVREKYVCYYNIENNLEVETMIWTWCEDYDENDFMTVELDRSHTLHLTGKLDKDERVDRERLESESDYDNILLQGIVDNEDSDEEHYIWKHSYRFNRYKDAICYNFIENSCYVVNADHEIYKSTWSDQQWTKTLLGQYKGKFRVVTIIVIDETVYLYLSNKSIIKVGEDGRKIKMKTNLDKKLARCSTSPLIVRSQDKPGCRCAPRKTDTSTECKEIVHVKDVYVFIEHGDIIIGNTRRERETQLEIWHKSNIEGSSVKSSMTLEFDNETIGSWIGDIAVHETDKGHNLFVSFLNNDEFVKVDIRYPEEVLEACSELIL